MSGPPGLNRTGVVAFVGLLSDSIESVSEPALLAHDGRALGVVAKEGDAVPGVPGATFSDFLRHLESFA